jgi:hypothetical protein
MVPETGVIMNNEMNGLSSFTSYHSHLTSTA